MKYACILLLIFQQAIPPKANTIVLKPVSFAEVCSALVEQGYQLEAKDSALQTVRTYPRRFDNSFNANQILFIRVKDSTAIITSTINNDLGSNYPVYNDAGSNGKTRRSIPGKAFTKMNEFALSFNKQIEYKRQP